MKPKSKYRYLFLILFFSSQCIFLSQIYFSHDFKLGNFEITNLNKVNRDEIIPFRSSSPSLISTYTEGIGYAQGVFIQDDVLFLTDSLNSSMTTIDVSNPTEPIFLDWFQSAENIPKGAFVEGNIAYLPSNFGLEILNISDPNNINSISWYNDDLGGSTNDVVVFENIAYITRVNDAFEIVNVSNPYSPEKINQIEGNFFEIKIKENYVFAIEDSTVLNIINITDPTNSTGTFKVMKRIEFADISDVFFNGDAMYVVEPTVGLFAYNITNPLNPQYITSLDLDGWWGKKAFIEKDIAYISMMNGNVKIIDVSDPFNLEVLNEYIGDGGSGSDIFVKDGIIYLADGAQGLEIIDGGYSLDTDGDGLTDFQEINIYNTDPYSTDTDGDFVDDKQEILLNNDPTKFNGGFTSQTLLSIINKSITFIDWFYPSDIEIQDDLLYAVDSAEGIVIFNISNIISPVNIYYDYIFGSCHKIEVKGDFAYISNSEYGLLIMNISNPFAPFIVGSCSQNIEYAGDIILDKDFVYLQDGDGIEIINVTNSSNPTHVSTYYNTAVNQFCVENNTLALYDGFKFELVDISNKENPQLAYNYPLEVNIGIELINNFLIISETPTKKIWTANITDLYNPELYTSEISVINTVQIDLSNEFLYAIDSSDSYEYCIANFSDPIIPEEVFHENFNLTYLDFEVIGDLICYFNGGDGLELYDLGYDYDSDGIGNLIEENIYHTSKFNADSDEDGYNDGYEISEGTNPLDPNDYPVEIVLEAPIITSLNRTVDQTSVKIEWQEVMNAEYYNIYLNGEFYISSPNTWVLLNFETEGTRIFTVTAVSGIFESEHSNPLEIIFDFPDDIIDDNNDDSDTSPDEKTNNDPFAQISIPGYPFEIFGLFLVFAIVLRISFLSKKKIFGMSIPYF